MNLKKFWKEAKTMLALVLAFALFFNGWSNYDFSVLAADELTVTVEDTINGTENPLIYEDTLTKKFIVPYANDTNGTIKVSGNTLAGDVYTGTVTVTPTLTDVYTICETETGNYADSLAYNETTAKPAELYLRDNSGNISKVTFPSFTFDNKPPTISVTAPAEEWVKEKEIKVIVDGADYGVFYTKGIKKELANPINKDSDLSGLTKLESDNLTIKENISEATDYYFYAIDKAGNVAAAEAKVNKVDVNNPVISVDPDSMVDSLVNGEYWKSNDDLVIPVAVTDNLSGFGSGCITVEPADDAAVLDLTFSADSLSVIGTVTIKQSGTYRIRATDKAGLLADEQVIAVKTDIKAPEVTFLEPTGENMYLDTINQVYWFSGANVTVPLTVVDEMGDGDTEQAPYTVIYSTISDMSNPTEVKVTNDEGNASITLDSGVTTYYFKAIDAAQNEGDVQSIKLALDDSAPDIKEAVITQLNGDVWINAAEFGGENSEHKVAFSVAASDAGSGIEKIKYSPDGGNTYHEADDAAWEEKNGVYTFVTNETYADGTGYQWKVRVTDNVGKDSDVWTFIDTEGNNLGQIDTAAPSDAAYIQFISDTVGANNADWGSVTDGKWTSKIYEIATTAWNKIWGKTAINFEVYVKDETSGIDSIEMSYNGKKIEGLKKEEGLRAFVTGDSQSKEGYTLYTGKITCQENSILTVQNFQIDKLTDVAGNVNEQPIVLNDAINTEIIYLDSIAPKLSIINGSENVDINDKYFYKAEQTITLTIEERFFEEKDKPKVTLMRREGIVGGFKEVEPTEGNQSLVSDWTHVDGTYQWQTTVTLPAVAGEENEYQIVTAYEDVSGNNLVNGNGIEGVSEGSFTSKIFVVDMLAPKLTDCSVMPTTKCTVDNAKVCKNDTSPGHNDLLVSFEFDDNETYYNTSKGNLIVELYKNGTELVKTLKVEDKDLAIAHASGGREYSCSFEYDGEADTENQYHVEIDYEDAAGNLIMDERGEPAEGNNPGRLDNGVYTSEKYIIDHIAPVFDIEYSDAVNVVNKNGVNAEGNKPFAEHKAYYNGNVEVTLNFVEKYAHIKADRSLEHYELKVYKDEAKTPLTGEELADVISETTWSHNGNVHTAKFEIKADKANHKTDGDYHFVVTYRDCAENAMVGNKENADLVKYLMSQSKEEGTKAPIGVYTSPVLVMDTTAPVVTTQYMNGENAVNPVLTAYGIDYFRDLNTAFCITVTDRNIRYGELKAVLSTMEAKDIKKIDISNSKLEDEIKEIDAKKKQCVAGNVDPGKDNVWTLNLPLTTPANYVIPVDFTDLAGNKAIINGSEGMFTEKVTTDSEPPEYELSYSVTDPANYLKWGYLFAKGQMNVKVTAKDNISGIRYIKFTITDENNKKTEKIKEFTPIGETECSVDIPLATRNFKGSVLAEIFDYSTNENEKICGHIVESAEKHSSTGKAVIQTITSPSRSVGGVDFYNTDVKFKLTLEDSYSGLASWKYTGGDTLKDTYSYKDAVGTDLKNLGKDPKKEITYSYEKELILSASGNNKNDVLITASYVDNVGHISEVEQKYNIDITKPEIEVTYDLNQPANDKYYKETRSATVKIKERNFDPADVEFLIISTNGPKPEISGWSSSGTGDDTCHTCKVTFSKDSDYTFTLKFQDMAGNFADYNRVDEFTIDKTIPVATVSYDNNKFLNEYYYDAARTATIDILEHNFDSSAVEIKVTADGETATVPHISAWSSNGDHNIATITFSADAEYTFDIAGMDFALNELEEYTPDHFVIDQTVPELAIFGIKNMSANNGVVRPGIRYNDTNYDKDGTVVQMTGYHNGAVEMTGVRKLEPNGLELKLNDFEYIQEMDDVYTMQATAYDLAGNSSEEAVTFSVNRFGSVYTFDEKTDALIGNHGRYYINKEQELVITETNVDTLKFEEITCNLNGKLTTLKEGQDYTVRLNGNEATWKQYTYTLKEDNFVKEGTYILTIYSEDRATNTSDNSSKGKKIEFVVDKTNPSVLISGVENNGQYRANSREMTLDIEDNVRLSQMVVKIDGRENVYDAAQIQEADGKFVMNIGSADDWQDIEVVVTDAAGNEKSSEEMRVLVTANIFVQYFMNKPIFYGSLGAFTTIAAFLWWFFAGKKNGK